MANETVQQVVVVGSPKSVGISIILTFLFGPLGMFYSTVGGAIIMMILSVILGAITLGIGLLITWPICVIWGALAASGHNSKIKKMVSK